MKKNTKAILERILEEYGTEYICYLETVGPKLAHYYGYLLGNAMLHRVIPGYQPDLALTLGYFTMLKNYFGTECDPNILLKSTLNFRE